MVGVMDWVIDVGIIRLEVLGLKRTLVMVLSTNGVMFKKSGEGKEPRKNSFAEMKFCPGHSSIKCCKRINVRSKYYLNNLEVAKR